ncbi:MAG: hypothetical protein V7K40_28655 [Nostoc sp.]
MKFFLFPLAIIFQLSDMVQNLQKQSSEYTSGVGRRQYGAGRK